MTPEEHNKYVGIAHLVYAGVHLLLVLLFMLFFLAMFMSATPSGPEGPPIGFMIAMWAFFSIFYGAFIIPSFIAGFGLLKRKKWAKTAAIIAGVLAAMFFPIGTAVCVYTFWFLFSEHGKVLYERPAYPLPTAPAWNRDLPGSKKGPSYIPPASPPDWR